MTIEIKHRSTNRVILVVEAANLYGANLRSADLRNADLRSADLRRAYLYGANLEDANLEDANLKCMGDMQYIHTMQLDTYYIGFTKDVLQIGERIHKIEDWRVITSEVAKSMDIPFIGWWGKWSEFIFKAIELTGK